VLKIPVLSANYLKTVQKYFCTHLCCVIIRKTDLSGRSRGLKVSIRRDLSTTQIILLSFLGLILIGSLLLWLPVSSSGGESMPYIDALFTSTTSVCVTGLVTVPTVYAWSGFGQAVILVLIQVGGLGIIAFMSMVMISLNLRMGIKDRMLIQDAFNLNTLSGLTGFVFRVAAGTFVIELIGALLYMTVFVPEYGIKGVWISVFTSVSAFCNAGLDIISENSLCAYVSQPVVNITTMLLIFLGGIGYIVWWDVIRVLKNFRIEGIRCFRKLTLHSKIAVCTSLILVFAGALLFFLFEHTNPLTVGNLPVSSKILASFFQSVTTRTAGFATLAQKNLTDSSSLVTLLLMFIGGSPAGTAGGVKTVTIAVLLVSAYSTIINKEDVVLFNRTVPREAVNKAVAVVCMSFVITLTSSVMLSAFSNGDLLDVMFEAVSAAATVGLSRDFTSTIGFWSKIVLIFTMYLGRVGPISLLIAFDSRKERKNAMKDPVEKISIG
jgi:trk system potassium uptake protein TrkH